VRAAFRPCTVISRMTKLTRPNVMIFPSIRDVNRNFHSRFSCVVLSRGSLMGSRTVEQTDASHLGAMCSSVESVPGLLAALCWLNSGRRWSSGQREKCVSLFGIFGLTTSNLDAARSTWMHCRFKPANVMSEVLATNKARRYSFFVRN
jgi:hypothetical protein